MYLTDYSGRLPAPDVQEKRFIASFDSFCQKLIKLLFGCLIVFVHVIFQSVCYFLTYSFGSNFSCLKDLQLFF